MDSEAFKTWNVKDFPVALRTRITDLASREGITVAEWVTAYFQKHGLDGGDLPEIPKPDYRANPGVAGGSEKTEPSADALDRAIERACKLAQHSASMPKVVADLAYGLVKDDLRGLKAGNGRDWPDLPRLPSGRFTPQIREKEPSELRTITAEFGSSRHVEPSNINELASSG